MELKWPLITSALATGRGPDWERVSQGRCCGPHRQSGGTWGFARAYTRELGCFVPLSLLFSKQPARTPGTVSSQTG